MRIFFAVPDSKTFVDIIKEENGNNILFSYAFFKDVAKVQKVFGDFVPENIIVDSGAFSVWSKGDVVDIKKYESFCKTLKDFIPVKNEMRFVNLDVLPGQFGRIPTQMEREESAARGWQNMLYLESKGLKVIPVYHQYESLDWLHRMMEHTDYIGISPANDASSLSKESFMKTTFSITRNKIRCHGFAVTGYSQLIKFPFYSVDSSSWASGGRFARIPIIVDGKMKSFNFKDKEMLMKFWDKIPHQGKNVLESYQDRIRVGVAAFVNLQKYITDIWKHRGVNWDEFIESTNDEEKLLTKNKII